MFNGVPNKYRHQLPNLGNGLGPGMSVKGFNLPSRLALLPVE